MFTCVLGMNQVAEPQVARLCVEAQECMVVGRWFDLVSLMLTSAEVIFSKVSEKGEAKILFSIDFLCCSSEKTVIFMFTA